MSIHIGCEGGFSSNKVEKAQSGVGIEQIRDVGTNQIGHFGEDSHNFAFDFPFRFADAIVGFHYFFRLYENGFAGGRFIVHNTLHLAFMHRCHREHQASIANGWGCVGIENAIGSSLCNDSAHDTIDTGSGGCNFSSQIEQ